MAPRTFLITASFLIAVSAHAQSSFTVAQKATFDKEETMRMVSAGSAQIKGQAFAKDNQSSFKGVAVLNINPRQYAPPGTTVILIPYTDYYKEWMEVSKKYNKLGKEVQLPEEAVKCIRFTQVADNEGHFEFGKLMPGQYMVCIEFGYTAQRIQEYTSGYVDHYRGNAYQGTTAITDWYHYNVNADASIKKVVTIKEAGEVVKVKLKKTL